MEQNNRELKLTLIQHYSKLSYKNSYELSERIKQNDWWIKETYRLKVQSFVAQFGYWFAIFIVSGTFIITIIDSRNIWHNNVSIIFLLSIVLMIKTVSNIEERIRVFEVMKLAFQKKEDIVDKVI